MKALEAEILSNPTFFQGIEGKVKEVAAKVSSGVGSVASRVSTVLPDTKVVEKMGDLATSVTRGLPEVRSAAQGAAKKAAEGAKEVWGKMFPVRREVSVDRAPYDDQALATEKEFHEGEEPESPKTPQ